MPPPAARRPSALPLLLRVPALLIALACAAPLLIGSMLRPSPNGHGTHTQLGLAPCGFESVTGLPCATCGMTTAFSHASHGQILTAFRIQPAGALLATLCAVSVLVCGYAAATGADLAPLGAALWRPRVIILLGGIVLAGWAYTLARALGS